MLLLLHVHKWSFEWSLIGSFRARLADSQFLCILETSCFLMLSTFMERTALSKLISVRVSVILVTPNTEHYL